MAIKNNVLVCSDTHIPAEHPNYLDFCVDLYKKYKCTKVVHCGDLCDFQASSFHNSDPDLPSAGDELKEVLIHLKPWFKAFPKMLICNGNHDEIPARKAKSLGVSKLFVTSLGKVLGAPVGWQFDYSHIVDGVLYKHVPQGSTLTAQLRAAERNTVPTVTGHLHSVAGVAYSAGYTAKMFAVAVGSGVDYKHLAMSYGKESTFKPVVSAAVILEGELPICKMMKM